MLYPIYPDLKCLVYPCLISFRWWPMVTSPARVSERPQAFSGCAVCWGSLGHPMDIKMDWVPIWVGKCREGWSFRYLQVRVRLLFLFLDGFFRDFFFYRKPLWPCGFGWENPLRSRQKAALRRGVWIPRPGRSCSAGLPGRMGGFWSRKNMGKTCDLTREDGWYNRISWDCLPDSTSKVVGFFTIVRRYWKVRLYRGNNHNVYQEGGNEHPFASDVGAREPRLNQDYINVECL